MSHYVGDACAGGHQAQTERQFSDAIVELARLCGWLVHRDPPWRATCADAGYPDLTLCHPVRSKLLFAELKLARGKCTPAQEEWHNALNMAGVLAYVWRPEDWSEIERALT